MPKLSATVFVSVVSAGKSFLSRQCFWRVISVGWVFSLKADDEPKIPQWETVERLVHFLLAIVPFCGYAIDRALSSAGHLLEPTTVSAITRAILQWGTKGQSHV